MTSKRELERRADDLDADSPGEGEVFVVAIGGDPNRPHGWLTREKYEEHYGPWEDRGGVNYR